MQKIYKRKKANGDIREKARDEGVCIWEIADRLNICDCNFSRKLRRELPDDEKQRIFSVIEQIKNEREAQECQEKEQTK